MGIFSKITKGVSGYLEIAGEAADKVTETSGNAMKGIVENSAKLGLGLQAEAYHTVKDVSIKAYDTAKNTVQTAKTENSELLGDISNAVQIVRSKFNKSKDIVSNRIKTEYDKLDPKIKNAMPFKDFKQEVENQ